MNSKKLWSTMFSLIATMIVLFAFGGMTVLADDTEDSGPEIVAQGYCGAEGNGESVSWTLDSNGLLTISGTGEMVNSIINKYSPWYNYKEVIEKVVIGEGVTSIGNSAFDGCTSLSSIVIPNSVTGIGNYAICNCTSLASIDIPDSVTSIGDRAFDGCSLLSAITIPDRVYSIGDYVFYNCTSLSSITIPNRVTSIGNNAFNNCASLASITIPNSVTRIGNSAFEGCTALASITIPDRVYSIGDYVFYNCTSLSSITIPNRVTSIGNNVFRNCTSLASITIPDSVTSIGNSAFEGCTALSSIVIPDRVTSIGNNVFRNCTSLASITIPDSVTSIGDSAFNNCTSLASITIPDSVTSIGNSAFEGCTALSSIVIPDSVTSIGNSAFEGCTALPSIVIPDSVTSIGDYAFYKCASLASITIPDSVTGIGNNAFYGCTSLSSIAIPNSVTSIGNNVFRNCTSLATITIPNSVTSIGNGAFYNCTSLATITIPNSVTSIGTGAFGDCVNLTEIRLKVNSDSFNDVLSNILPTSIKALVYVPNDHLETYRYLFSSFENVIVLDLDGNFSLQDSGSHLYGYSLSLDGSIGVNFYMRLSDEVLNNNDTAYMRFTVNGKEQIVPVKDLTPNKEGYYIFRCNVVAKEMADEITAQVYLSENNPVGDAYTYSVREYAAYIIEHPEKYSVKAVELVKAMLNYGAAAQTYFGYHTSDLANSILPTGEQQSSSLSVGNLSLYKKGDVLPELVSILLKSTITMKLYFKTEDLEAKKVTSFKYKNETLTATVSGDYTIVAIEGISAQNFIGIVTINYYVEGSEKAESIKYRPSNYAYAVLNQPTGGVITEELKEVVSALYSFSWAANEYNSGIQPA